MHALHCGRVSTITRPLGVVPARSYASRYPLYARGAFAAPHMERPHVLEREGVSIHFSFAPIYRVILHYNVWSDNKDAAKRVARAVDVLSMSDALRIVEAAVLYGSAIVVTVPLGEASSYEHRLRQAGLRASLEQA
jgi:hypothetical protein